MKVTNESLGSVLESAIIKSLSNYELSNDGSFLGDLYFRFDEDTKLSIYDDMENLLNEVTLQEEQATISNTLFQILQKLEQEHFFDKEYISKPFTVSLIDEDFISTEELIFIDDDTLKLEGEIWSKLDKELDDFLKNLMK